MNNKKLLIATSMIAALAVSLTAQAEAEASKVATPYIEGQIGFATIDGNVDTDAFTGSIGSATATNARGKLDYDSTATYGVEVGFKDVMIPNLRIGAGVSTMKFDFHDAQVVSGTIVNGSTSYNSISASDAASFGYSLDNRVNLYMINAYYDFKTFTDLTPFIGLGLGFADIKHAKDIEFAYDVNAGVKYNISKNIYVGVKAAYTVVNGPTDKTGIKFHDIDVYSANASVGYEF